MKVKILYLEWDDHWTHNTGWVHHKEEDAQNGEFFQVKEGYKPAPCKAVGFVVYEDKKVYILSPFMALDGEQHKQEVCVLKSCVTKKKLIKI